MWPCSGTVFADQLVERPHIRRLSGVATPLRHLLITLSQTDKLVEGTLYIRWKRWGDEGGFVRMMEGLAAAGAEPKTVMIDVTYLEAPRTASSLRVKGDLGRLIGRIKGGMNTSTTLAG